MWYDPFAQRWTIYNEDKSALPSGAAFNVVVAGGLDSYTTQVATVANTVGDSTCTGAFGPESDDALIITHIYSGYFTDVSAVWWDSSLREFCVFDGSGNAMPLGATFTVAVIWS
jgi:hypothetical protein